MSQFFAHFLTGMSRGYDVLYLGCSEGWYCSGGATQSMPSDPAEGGPCLSGTYCPGGSDAPTNCTAGYYCGTDRLPAVSGQCIQGNVFIFDAPIDILLHFSIQKTHTYCAYM